MRKIVHVDADSFDASVEMRDDPRLRHLPIAVTVGKRPIDNFMVEKGDSTKEVRLKFLYLNRNMLCVNRVANRQKRTRAAYQNINFNSQL